MNELERSAILIADYEALRTSALRALIRQADLLDDGLHALRHGRTAVAEEFVERSLVAIRKEIEILRDVAIREEMEI
jgi:hypothetical protein